MLVMRFYSEVSLHDYNWTASCTNLFQTCDLLFLKLNFPVTENVPCPTEIEEMLCKII